MMSERITLENLVNQQKYTDESDIELIKKWFIFNNAESEGITLMADLSKAKSDKLELVLNNARTWIPIVPDVYECNKRKVSKDVAMQLQRFTYLFLLDMPLGPKALEWAKETIPTLNTPKTIFRPMVEWLKNEYGIEFADKMI